MLAVVSAVAGWALTRRQAEAKQPLLDPQLLRSHGRGSPAGLSGYLVLFGPLVLVPVVLARQGVGPVASGLVLTALPLGFALAATTADRLLPASLSDRARAGAGSLLCSRSP